MSLTYCGKCRSMLPIACTAWQIGYEHVAIPFCKIGTVHRGPLVQKIALRFRGPLLQKIALRFLLRWITLWLPSANDSCQTASNTHTFWFPFTNGYIVIPFYNGLHWESYHNGLPRTKESCQIVPTTNTLWLLSTEDCIVPPFYKGLHWDSYYNGLHCDFLLQRNPAN